MDEVEEINLIVFGLDEWILGLVMNDHDPLRLVLSSALLDHVAPIPSSKTHATLHSESSYRCKHLYLDNMHLSFSIL